MSSGFDFSGICILCFEREPQEHTNVCRECEEYEKQEYYYRLEWGWQ